MDIRRRTILWLVLAVSLFMLWDNWQVSKGGSSVFRRGGEETKQAASPKNKTDVTSPSAQSAAVPMTSQSGSREVVKNELITITTDVITAQFATVGGVLQHLELLQHRDKVDPSKNMVLFDESPNHTYLAQTGLVGNNLPNHRTPFTVKPGPRSLDGANELQLVMQAEQGGVVLTKTFTFHRGDYTINVKHEITNRTSAPIDPSLYLQLVRDGSKPEGESMFASTFTGPAVYTESSKFQKLDYEKIEKGKEEHATKADNGWIALVQHYFVTAFIPQDKLEREIFTRKVDTNLYAIGDILPVGTVAPGATATIDARLFAGPQDSAMLDKVAPGLELVKDYGMLTIIAKPIFWLMTQIQKEVGNWGWTIIVLTILIKLAFFPLASASYRSMANMKKVTPKMQAIRERYENDKPRRNQEIMALYKAEKINPVGGCMPVVVQIPVFISLYWVLLASVEIRNTPWLGWIQDLAAPDPYFILPIIMAVSMFVQQRMSPPPPDPVQAKMMLFMPLVFSITFFFFPAGLVLYWVVNNLLSIAQQWWVTKRFEKKNA
jgi:YidC/Oxa1 family membrane protein insertase